MAQQAYPALAILRRKQVQSRTGLSRSTIYTRISEGTFPPSIPLGARAVGWLESEIENWLIQQVNQARGTVLGSKK